ncbi:MAG: P-type conjugative transfer protein TrbG [Sphingomonadales bacterium 32-68-7]|nr:MAG: P-type conjugative transfer protein TrbG [Sphingomonadales bacterium 12-68-11]OYX10405.1 MAG: P-type conjugative transfer protein TrbG [Sphingomonadales bacterium 32-68-7]
MTRSPLLLAALALGACAGKPAIEPVPAPPPPASYAAAVLAPDALAPELPTAAVLAVPAPVGPLAEPIEAAAGSEAQPLPDTGPPLARVAAANRSAVREPSREGYLNAVQVYDWADGALYRLYTAPERVSEIALQPGETLVSVAAGDTVRWVIGDTTSGAGASRRSHILVKPTAAGLRTNLVVATDRRVYHISLESSAGSAMASISWAYPQDALLVVNRAETMQAAPAVPAPEGPDLEALNFAYTIEGDEPSWRPLRAFDDGSQVFIEFPVRLAQDEAPPLFVSGEGGRPELVNYRVRGRYYVVDRLFAAAELRLGERRQQIVRILAGGAPGRRGSIR